MPNHLSGSRGSRFGFGGSCSSSSGLSAGSELGALVASEDGLADFLCLRPPLFPSSFAATSSSFSKGNSRIAKLAAFPSFDIVL